MESYLLARKASGRKMVSGELIRGRKFAQQLQLLLHNSTEGDSTGLQLSLVNRIWDSFNRSLSKIESGESNEVSEVPAVDSPCFDGRRKCEDSGESSRSPVRKDRRGCYKRKKTSERCIKVSPTWLDDGRAWRKYGQKDILHAKYPRSYFRCTHRFEQGCPATKHVQQIQDDPPKFRTTYYDNHTCKNSLKTSQLIIVDPAARDDSSKTIWNFESPNYEPSCDPVEQGNKKRVGNLANDQAGPSNFYIPADDITRFDQTSGPLTAISLGSDHGDVISSDVYSCSGSTHSKEDMDRMIESVLIDDVFLEY